MNSWLEAIEQLEQANARLSATPLDDTAGISATLTSRENVLESFFQLPADGLESALLERLGNAYEAGEGILRGLLAVRESLREELARLRNIEQVQGICSSEHFASLVDLQG